MSTTATITGTLIREPEIRYTKAGMAQTLLLVEADEATRIEVVAQRDLAENIALSLAKGAHVIVIGQIDGESKGTFAGHAGARILALEVGVCLSTATADVHRTTRRSFEVVGEGHYDAETDTLKLPGGES